MELPLIRPKDRKVVHVAEVMVAQTALPDKLIERLENDVGEPLGTVAPDQDAILDNAPDEIEDSRVFDELTHTSHNDARLQTVVEVPDVQLLAVFGSLRVFPHPPFDGAFAVMRTTTLNTAATVFVHAPHEDRFEDLDQGVMNVLIRPEQRLVDVSPLLCALVVTPFAFRLRLNEAVDNDLSELCDALVKGLLDPRNTGVRTVVRPSAVGLVDLDDRLS